MELKTFVSFDWPMDQKDEEREDYDSVPPGRGILEHIRNALASRGFDVGPIDQHKFYGWCFESHSDGVTIWSMLQHPGPWLLISEPRHPFLKRLFGQARSEPLVEVCSVLDDCLKAAPQATTIRWFSRSEFSTQEQANGALAP